MKKVMFFLWVLMSFTCAVSAQVESNDLVGKWRGGGESLVFGMDNGMVNCSMRVGEEIMTTDNVAVVDSVVYVDFVIEKRHGGDFSTDVAAAPAQGDKQNVAVSRTARRDNNPQLLGEPADFVVRHRMVECKMNADGTMMVEYYTIEERVSNGSIEYRYGKEKGKATYVKL